MICGIGVDTVEVVRFAQWHTYSRKTLSRIFSDEEIEYCLAQINKSAERFAVRFAAREAFFKAFSYAFPSHTVPFLTLCKNISIQKKGSRPFLVFDWLQLSNPIMIHVSLSHTKTIATAYVIIEER